MKAAAASAKGNSASITGSIKYDNREMVNAPEARLRAQQLDVEELVSLRERLDAAT